MPCPTCGGIERDQIAPGLWRCTSIRLIVTETGGPGLTDPRAGPGVIRQERFVPCNTEYQEGDSAGAQLECACGTFAIGRCAECRRPVCGTHSELRADKRVCRVHEEQRQRARSAASEAAERAGRKAEEQELHQTLDALAATRDPAKAATLMEHLGGRLDHATGRAVWERLAGLDVIPPTHDIIVLNGRLTATGRLRTLALSRNYELGAWREVDRLPAWAGPTLKVFASSLGDGNRVWLDQTGEVFYTSSQGGFGSDDALHITTGPVEGLRVLVPTGHPFCTVRPRSGHRRLYADRGRRLWETTLWRIEDYRATVLHALRGQG